MKIALFSNKSYTERFFTQANSRFGHEILFIAQRLNHHNASIAQGCQAVCVFVNDILDKRTITALAKNGVNTIALRCAGFNNVDLKAARDSDITVVRVPAYSPHAVAEHTIAMILVLNRKIHKAHARIREGNFSLKGLMGFDLHDYPVGIIGTGQIGQVVARILHGFGCRIMAYDPQPNIKCIELGVQYVSLDELFRKSYIITLHCPLVPETHHIINANSISKMQDCVMIINTSRGALIDTKDVIDGLKSRKIGYLGLDVYEEEADLFFEDLSNEIIQDDQFARLLMFPNVIVTGHQAFFTNNALQSIAQTTLENITDIEQNRICPNLVTDALIVH
ncbi:MAG: 2-hydroxyacid dehydrogenase [Planctomycetes bacterium]|nr:2-hydroxyacid dehydrogenase [Planctomycetota bacterium]